MSDLKRNDNTKRFLKELQGKELRYVASGGELIKSNMQTRAPKDSGNLINSIKTESFVEEGRAVSETGPTADYAVYVEYGTGVHAVNGQGRKTPWTYQAPDGKWYTTIGAKAQPFAEPGFQAAIPGINAIAKRILPT